MCSNSCDGGMEANSLVQQCSDKHLLQGNKQLIVLPLMPNIQKRTKDLEFTSAVLKVYEVSPHSPHLKVTEYFKFFRIFFRYIEGYCDFHFRFDRLKQTVC